MQVKISDASSMLEAYLKADLVPMVVGSPGIGKSQIVHALALMFGLKVIDLRLSQCDPTDLMGFPHIFGERAGYVPMNTFPIEGDEIPKGYTGWLIFLDEFNSASPAVQAAAYKLVLDRMVGQYRLHKNVKIVCAGNLDTDNAIVESMSTALQSRLVHIEVTLDVPGWIDWAISKNFDHRITDYIKFKAESLFTFRPDHTDKTYACPRTWEFANRLMPVMDTHPRFRELLSGVLSEGVALEFISFCRVYHSLPKPEQLLKDPTGFVIPDEISVKFALTGVVSSMANEDNLDQLVKFIVRLPNEFQAITIKEIVKRDMKLLNHKAMNSWKNTAVGYL